MGRNTGPGVVVISLLKDAHTLGLLFWKKWSRVWAGVISLETFISKINVEHNITHVHFSQVVCHRGTRELQRRVFYGGSTHSDRLTCAEPSFRHWRVAIYEIER